ncbi:hypothetical protein [Saccharopolyspora spinosa]|uniref:hypothetical protein n=1 Tax=Saccharopolyspora spinosa TaxID=60894 RepID=UPI00376EA791
MEELAERGPLTVEQEAELAELQPKAQEWQKKKEAQAGRYRGGKVAADRVAVLEELAERAAGCGAEAAGGAPAKAHWQRKGNEEKEVRAGWEAELPRRLGRAAVARRGGVRSWRR